MHSQVTATQRTDDAAYDWQVHRANKSLVLVRGFEAYHHSVAKADMEFAMLKASNLVAILLPQPPNAGILQV